MLEINYFSLQESKMVTGDFSGIRLSTGPELSDKDRLPY